jgi:hypothetical protein
MVPITNVIGKGAATPRINQARFPMDKATLQAEALSHAVSGQSFSNYPAIITGFTAKGVPGADIKPRENVFTFNAWKALGRSVKKGEHGVQVVTFIDCTPKSDSGDGGDKPKSYRRPWTTTVFHVTQTEPSIEIAGCK